MKKKVKLNESSLAQVEDIFKNIPSADEVSEQLRADYVDFDKDSEFVAEYLKMQFVEDIYRLLDRQGLKPSHLAERLGKSRQYVSRILNEKANFTFETMAAITCALDARVAARMYSAEERMVILPAVSQQRLLLLTEFSEQQLAASAPGLGEENAGNIAA